MKGYWEINVRNRFYRTFEELEFLQKGFPFMRSDWECDSNFDVIVKKVDLAAETLQSAFELYETMIKGVR